MSPTLAPRLIHLNVAALRWPNKRPSEMGDYLVKILKAGIKINGTSYWFFGHSNSHLRSRSCILMSADRPETVHNFVLGMGDFQRIRTAAKFAKRIGLLFSTADTGLDLPTELTEDIPDVMSTDGKVEMSDGCGLISYNFSRALAKKLDIHFQGNIYVPNVFQLRYRGYKGVVATCFALDAKNSKREAGSPKIQAQFRSSMRKFNASGSTGTLFSVVGYSKPFTFGSLNSEHATLLSSLGISNEVFLKKQAEHFHHIFNATTDIESAILLLSTKSLGDIVSSVSHSDEPHTQRLELVQELAIKGLEDPEVQRKFRRLQDHEMSLAINKRGEEKVRILIPQSRRLYGVCDETDSLREGTVFIRVQVPRKGLVTLVNVDVIIVRNPCLHPGDILKRRAVDPGPDYGKFRTECLVFSGKGQRPDASMSSGGDLDGDEFFVCWDKDLIPANVSESYDYPAPKARREPPVTQDRLIEYFARYNTGSLGKVKKYYLEWLRATPRGALGPECQELNALHSDAVDGGAVRIPERLLNVPKNPSDAFILDVLSRKGKEFSEEWQNIHARRLPARGPIPGSAVNNPVTERDLLTLLSSESLALPEYLRFQIMLSYCRRTGADPSQFMPHFHWGELTPNEKYVVQSIAFWDPRYDPGPGLWNSLERSPLLKGYNLKAHHLDGPLSLQRLYTSETDRMLYFFRKLKVAIDYFHRFLIVMKVNSRFTVIIYKCTPIVWGEESLVGNGVRIMALTNAEGRHGSTAVATSFLLTGPRIFQLYSKDLRDTFVFVNMVTVKGVETVQTSIALQKIDSIIQRHVGAVRREDVQEIEIHVVSNRDRVASQQLDLAFNFVGTEEIIRRISRDPKVSVKDSLQRVEWSTFPTHWKEIVLGAKWQFLDGLEEKDVGDIVQFCVSHHAAHRVIPIVDHLLDQRGVEYAPVAVALMSDYAPLLSLLLSNRLHVSPTKPDAELLRQSGFPLLQSLVSIANFAGEATVWIIQDRFLGIIESLHPKDILELMWRASFSVHAPLLSHLIIQVLREMKTGDHSGGVLSHALKLGAAVCIEYSGQLADQLRPSSSNIQGLPRAKSKELLISPKVDEDWQISFDFRKDADLRPRSGDHLRLRDAITDSKVEVDIIDCIVTKSYDGNATLQSYHVPPPQMEDRSWRVYVTGPTATVKAEMDAVAKMTDLTEAPIDLTTIICGGIPDPGGSPLLVLDPPPDDLKLNDSQKNAVAAVRDHRLTLIWGPPGTGKTSVVANILFYLLHVLDEEDRILLTASTNNAVDNVLERLLTFPDIDSSKLIRAATDESKVSQKLHHLTVSAMEYDTPRGREEAKKAQKRIEAARIVFTTCAGSGLGLVRKMNFEVAVVDEASQIVESVALIPLMKGAKRAVLVGDHVQLRPNVTPAAAELQHDRSLFERLYTEYTGPEVGKRMLEVQYRSGAELANFASQRFYEGRLSAGLLPSDRVLHPSAFPWPMTRRNRVRAQPYPCVFVQCDSEESYGGQSKHNVGQTKLVRAIVQKLQSPAAAGGIPPLASFALLTPYTKMRTALEALHLPNSSAITIDGAQGREYDYVVFATVRCNIEREIGFLKDERRLNVALTRARYGRIIVGDRATLIGAEDGGEVWRAALDDCEELDASLFIPPEVTVAS